MSQTYLLHPNQQHGNVRQVGDTNQVGNYYLTGNMDVTGNLGLSGYLTLQEIFVTGGINNNHCCQLTRFNFQSIFSFGVYTKITGLSSSNSKGFNNLNANMDNGTSDIKITRAGKYRLVGRVWFEFGTTYGAICFGKNGSFFEEVVNAAQEGNQAYIEFVTTLAVNDLISLYAFVDTPGDIGGTANKKGSYLRVELLY